MALTLKDKERALFRAQAVLREIARLLEDNERLTVEDLAAGHLDTQGLRELADRVDEIHSEYWFRLEQQR